MTEDKKKDMEDIEILPGQVWKLKPPKTADIPQRILINPFDMDVMEELDLYSIMDLSHNRVLDFSKLTGLTGKTIRENYTLVKTIDLPWAKTEEDLMKEFYNGPGMQFA